MRVLVTGAEGFVGRRLVARLRSAGHEVSAVDRELDVADARAVSERVAELQPDAIAHLAAISFVPDSVREPELAFRVNFLGTQSVLAAVASRAPGARVLVVSSGAVYGNAGPEAAPFDEASPLRPDSPYAWSKAAADQLAGVWRERGVQAISVRPFNHTGVGRPDQFAESAFARQLAEIRLGQRPARLGVGNLEAVRDFLDVEDVIDAYVALLEGGAAPGTYNVASGVGRPIGWVLETLLECAGLRDQVEVGVEKNFWRPTDRMVGDAGRLRAALGWAPRRRLEETLAALFEDWLAQLSTAS